MALCHLGGVARSAPLSGRRGVIWPTVRALVHPRTGRNVPPGTPGAIAREAYYSRQLVDAKTGRLVPPGSPGTVPRGMFYNRRMVDPDTGEPVAEAPDAMPSGRYRQRQFAARRAAKADRPTGRGRGRPRRTHQPVGRADTPQGYSAP
jgi:hypothetical protein